MAKRPVTVNDLLAGQVALDVSCADRVYLNGYVPTLQNPGQIVGFLSRHLGNPIPSPALMDQIGQRFRRAVDSYARANHIPVVRFGKGQRKVDLLSRARRSTSTRIDRTVGGRPARFGRDIRVRARGSWWTPGRPWLRNRCRGRCLRVSGRHDLSCRSYRRP
jgi:hypothetical protein